MCVGMAPIPSSFTTSPFSVECATWGVHMCSSGLRVVVGFLGCETGWAMGFDVFVVFEGVWAGRN